MIVHRLSGEVLKEGTCSDCGRLVGSRKPFIDPHTRSNVELCSNCAVAFLQRQHLASGYCE
jgi:hypothetical protein